MPAVAATQPLTVELPVCPEPTCRRIGKIPANHFGGKEFCAGEIKNSHKRRRMVKRTFRLLEDGEA